MDNEIHEGMIQRRGAAYGSDRIASYSHYREPIDDSPGRLAGNSRIWGDASPEVQSRVIDALIESSREQGLTPRETAHVLAIARLESGFNPDAAAGTTSAAGLGQFIDRTGRSYGLNGSNRFDAVAASGALVRHFIDNRNLARSRGQGEEYIYKYHHDGPTRDYGGLGLANREVMPRLDEYERFVLGRLSQQRDPQPQETRVPPAGPRQPSAPQLHPVRTFDDVMRVMLPPRDGVDPHMTSDYGHRMLNGRPDDHGGVDFNYVGGQNGINLRHPVVRSPVSGTVIYGDGQGAYGTVKIRDGQGNVHEILHLDSRSVRATNPPTRIEAGDIVGTMGGRGPNGAGQYAQHVHYQVRDRSGRTVDPEEFWRGRRIDMPAGAHAPDARGPRPQRNPAIADGVLRRGERGDDVLGLQRSLNRLGMRDARGNPLEEDGRFGDRTFEAVEAYQCANGLKVDGIAGPRTLGSIGGRLSPGQVASPGESRQSLRADDPAHPDHATYHRIHAWVQGTGHWNEEQARNVAAALYRAQLLDPLVQRVDRVVGGRGPDGAENVFAVYAPHGDREPTFHARVDGRVASREPAASALDQAERLREALQTPERVMQQAPAPAMRTA